MAYKEFSLNNQTLVTIYKRKGSRNMRISMAPSGKVKISIPAWAPYAMGLGFAESKRDWILKNSVTASRLEDNQPIGKAHHLSFAPKANKTKPSSKISGGVVLISHNPSHSYQDDIVQAAARKAAIRALRSQAQALLPQRLQTLATKYGFSYKSVSIKLLKSRWGSCDQHSNIVLNLYLMQMPWDLIDYVLLHELTHTRLLKHGPQFWQNMEELMPNVKSLKKQLRSFQPELNSSKTQSVA